MIDIPFPFLLDAGPKGRIRHRLGRTGPSGVLLTDDVLLEITSNLWYCSATVVRVLNEKPPTARRCNGGTLGCAVDNTLAYSGNDLEYSGNATDNVGKALENFNNVTEPCDNELPGQLTEALGHMTDSFTFKLRCTSYDCGL